MNASSRPDSSSPQVTQPALGDPQDYRRLSPLLATLGAAPQQPRSRTSRQTATVGSPGELHLRPPPREEHAHPHRPGNTASKARNFRNSLFSPFPLFLFWLSEINLPVRTASLRFLFPPFPLGHPSLHGGRPTPHNDSRPPPCPPSSGGAAGDAAALPPPPARCPPLPRRPSPPLQMPLSYIFCYTTPPTRRFSLP